MYPNQTSLYIIATACDNINECLNNEDEEDCGSSSFTTPILISSLLGIIGIFIALTADYECYFSIGVIAFKISHIREFFSKKEENIEAVEVLYKILIEKLKENHTDKDNNNNLNRYLLHILNTKKTELTRKIYIEFYDNLDYQLSGCRSVLLHETKSASNRNKSHSPTQI